MPQAIDYTLKKKTWGPLRPVRILYITDKYKQTDSEADKEIACREGRLPGEQEDRQL